MVLPSLEKKFVRSLDAEFGEDGKVDLCKVLRPGYAPDSLTHSLVVVYKFIIFYSVIFLSPTQ